MSIEIIDEPPRPGKAQAMLSGLLFAVAGYFFIYDNAAHHAITTWGMKTAGNIGMGGLWLIGGGGTVGFVLLYWVSNLLAILLYFFRSSLRGGFAEGAIMGAAVSVVWLACDWIRDWIVEIAKEKEAKDPNWIRYMFLIPINIMVGSVCGIFVERISFAGRQLAEWAVRAIVFAFVAFWSSNFILVFVGITAPLFGLPELKAANVTHGVILCLSMVPYFLAGDLYFRAPNEKGGALAGFKLGLFFAVFGALDLGIPHLDDLDDKEGTIAWVLISLGAIAATTLAGAMAKKM